MSKQELAQFIWDSIITLEQDSYEDSYSSCVLNIAQLLRDEQYVSMWLALLVSEDCSARYRDFARMKGEGCRVDDYHFNRMQALICFASGLQNIATLTTSYSDEGVQQWIEQGWVFIREVQREIKAGKEMRN